MPYIEVSTIVSGELSHIWDIVQDMEGYPKFMPNLQRVEVLERGDNSTVSSWVSNVDGRIIKWKERDVFFPDQYRIEYCQVSGDLKKFEGHWQLTPVDGGVKIVLTVDFEFGIPMVATLLNPLLKKKVRENSEGMLAAIKSICESQRE